MKEKQNLQLLDNQVKPVNFVLILDGMYVPQRVDFKRDKTCSSI
jgi:hypothetical protein